MLSANPNSTTSFSSTLAKLLVNSTGVRSQITESIIKPSVRKSLAKSYTNKIRAIAASPDMWGNVSESLVVEIGDDDHVSIRAEGTDEDIYSAELLEYGTPDRPPRAIMRPFSITLSEDFKQSIKDLEG